MPNEKLLATAREAGVNSGDVAVLERAGLTPGLVDQAEAKGWSIKDIWDLYQQFGPAIITFLTSLFTRGNVEGKVHRPRKPPADDELKK